MKAIQISLLWQQQKSMCKKIRVCSFALGINTLITHCVVTQHVLLIFFLFQQNQISDIIPAILSAEVVIAASNDWRLQETIIDHFRCFRYLTSSETIYNKIMPVLFNKLRRSVSLHPIFSCR